MVPVHICRKVAAMATLAYSLVEEIGAESSVKLTQRPVVGGVEEEENALPMILVGSCKKSGCLSYLVCVLYTHIYRCNDQIPTQIV